jgi:chitinase
VHLTTAIVTTLLYIGRQLTRDKVDWEHPSSPEEGLLFLKLMETLRKLLPRPRYTLTAALPAGEWCLRNINLTRLLSSHHGDPCLDYLHLMAYDFSGPWTEFSGHQAQLQAPDNPSNAFEMRSITNATRFLVDVHSVDPSRIVIGIPVYGRSFLGVTGPGQRFINHSQDSKDVFDYFDLPRPGTKEVVDMKCGAASCLGDGGWVTYDCPITVRLKGDFAKKLGLGGLFFWTGFSDAREESRSLVVAGYESLH